MENIAIIIPVYNEQDSLPETIEQMDRMLKTQMAHSTVIFVNDGSTDNSKKILEEIENPGFHTIHHQHNIGYGAALKTGIRYSNSEYICITDADGTYPNNEIPGLIKKIQEGYSMVVGSRTGDTVKIPLFRRLPKWLLNKLANYLTGIKIPDINSGLRVMRKRDIKRFFRLLPDGFSFTTTITIAMLTNNLTVHFTPINYYRRTGLSKIRPVADTINFFQLMIRTSLYFKPLKVFLPLSFSLVFSAFFLLFGSWMIFGRPMDVTFGILIMSAVLFLAIGMLADLINKRIE